MEDNGGQDRCRAIHSRMPQGQGVETHTVGTPHHRSIVAIVEKKIRNADESLFFHLDGHELRWKPDAEDGSPEFSVLSKLYNLEAFLEAQRLVRSSPPTEALKDCTLPRVIVGLSFWSDATHPSTFPSSKLWPLYMVFGNDSKYRRGKGSAEACYHCIFRFGECLPYLGETAIISPPFYLPMSKFRTPPKTTPLEGLVEGSLLT